MANNSATSNGDVTLTGDVVYFCPEMFDFETISGAFFILIFILSLTGNLLLLYVLFVFESLKNVTNIFILNLACSDLIFAVTLPFWAVHQLHHWVFGELACKFTTGLYFVGLHSSIILLTAMTVDRFVTVVMHNCPSNTAGRQRCALAACVAAWAISLAASVNEAIKVKVETYRNNVSFCEDPSNDTDVRLGYYLQVSLLFIVPFAIMVFCYSAILKTVLQTSNRRRYRTVVVVFCIVAAFFFCWGPYNILLFISVYYEHVSCYAKERFDIAYSICRILAFSHCCMNPLLYMLSQNLRRHLLQLLLCKKAMRKREERGTAQSTSVNQNVAFVAQNSVVHFGLT